MTDQTRSYSPAVQKLFAAGDARKMDRWREGEYDYVTQFGLTQEHAPELIDLAETWADEDREWPADDSVYAPIHAWRALGQLRATEAIEPLLAMVDPLDERRDDWHLDEFPHVFGWIGPPAISHLAPILSDQTNSEHTRVMAAHSLGEVAKRYSEAREEVVRALTEHLERREPSLYLLNSCCISELLDLRAVESAEAIERAFSAGVVDEGYCGDWDMVREELGAESLGLPQPRNAYNSIEEFRQSMSQRHQGARQENRKKQRKQLQAKLKKYRQKRTRK